MQVLWRIKEGTGRSLGTGRRTNDSLHIREERAERSREIIGGETVLP